MSNYLPPTKNRKVDIKKVLIISGILLFLYFFLFDKPAQRGNINSSSPQTTSDSPTNSRPSYSDIIQGLAPVDVYLNMEKQGFQTEKDFSSEHGNTWTSKATIDGISYQVSIYSMGADNVETVKATAMIDPTTNNIRETLKFICYVGSTPFTGAEPEKTIEWIKNNFNNDKASIVVNGVRFTIYSPTDMVRLLTIEKD